ncbi:hypothetical protein [Pseudomonas sp. MYb118]|uniref:hypothetical protein n=1 Tax=Pseudomonas sp. MYb118 TaxID=1848720 RepID=UPI0034CE60A6
MTEKIWLEVDKVNRAIMSYYLQPPTSFSSKFDYIEATQDELIFLNALEEAVFAPGTVATLEDLEAHRERVRTAKAARSNVSTKHSGPINKPAPNAATSEVKAAVLKQMRQHWANKRK